MRKLYIIGAGGMGRELESILDSSKCSHGDWEIAGYLHSGTDILADYPSDYRILGDWNDFDFRPQDLALMAVSDYVWKRKIAETLKDRVEFLTFIHPDNLIGKFTKIGKGCVIYPLCTISTNVTIDDFVMINTGGRIGHDAHIGEFSSLMSDVDIGGWAKVGKNVFMGTKSTLVPKKTIEDNCQIAAGAVVMCHVKTGKTMFGNPAAEMS